MPDNPQFFDTQSEQSAIKAQIVSEYFKAWASVIQTWDSNMAYIDLFCGPGKYKDENLSAPLLILQHTLTNPALLKKMFFLFNDENPEYINSLKRSINEIDSGSKLKGKIKFYERSVTQASYKELRIPSNLPVLSFVDPFGYKGVTMELINTLIENSGSDCIFFFNYSRVNMALGNNPKFDEHLIGIFGKERTTTLKQQLDKYSADQRERVVLDALIDSLKENLGNYILPFKFYGKEKMRTSHFIIFVTKHPLGCKIMKKIMYRYSAKDVDDVATFSFEDRHNFDDRGDQVSLFDRPLSSLQNDLVEKYSGQQVVVRKICESIECDFSNHFIDKNVKDALRRLEEERKLIVSGRKKQTQNGKITMPDNATIQFL